MEYESKYPRIEYNDIKLSRTVLWQTGEGRYCLMFWEESLHSEFIAQFTSYHAARNYMIKEFPQTIHSPQ